MEINLDVLKELLEFSKPNKDCFDIISSLSVPILSLTTLIVTTIISIKQWLLMKREYLIKLYPERFEIYKRLDDLLFKLKQSNDIIAFDYKNSIIEIENRMYIYNNDIICKYNDLKSWIIGNKIICIDFDKKAFTNDLENKLLALINSMKEYLGKLYIK